jgi:hypothetical protein
MAKKLATPPTELLRLLAINAYTSYRNTLVGSPAPRVAELYRELSAPQVGDLVLEVSTAPFIRDVRKAEKFKESLAEGAYLGYLVSITNEPVCQVHECEEPWDEAFQGGPEPLEKVWTLRTLLTGRLHRWHNARFIKVLDEYKF